MNAANAGAEYAVIEIAAPLNLELPGRRIFSGRRRDEFGLTKMR